MPGCSCEPISEPQPDRASHSCLRNGVAIPLQAPDARRIQKRRGGSSCLQPPRLYAQGFHRPVAARMGFRPGSRLQKSRPSRANARRPKQSVSTHSGRGNLHSGLGRERPCPDRFFPACSATRTRWLYEPPARKAQAVAAASAKAQWGEPQTESPYKYEFSNLCW